MFEPRPGQWIVVRSRLGEDYTMHEVDRCTGSLVVCRVNGKPAYAAEKRIGKSRVIFVGNDHEALTMLGLLKSAAGEYRAAQVRAKATYERRVATILDGVKSTLTTA